jgi:DNA mismatch endonuclease (patch repair protein)
MGAIRSRENRTTEIRFRAILIRAGIRGWSLHPKGLKGKPDFFFPASRVAVFIDGCFWHGCPQCGHIPGVNRPFWKAKLDRNRERDKAVDEFLQQSGIRPVRIWEHELQNNPSLCLIRLRQLISPQRKTGTNRG